ncbi:hypothetical protein A9179_02425 [Pseudomonas alcaligenes]|uniref:DNA primase DNAG catalytic core N-terminal domain-containing protein n=1 Tax=Aquipseudomonas alcaligenes TaxID=43263 RepID=A0ABR7RV59_AQUAC|nr:hypothetical protein [Pseudomonas alcaligenes]MBC9249125.1 hypothetical protein [Pseudomonas alcaligenes]
MYEPHQIQHQDVLIHYPILRCAYNDGMADRLVVNQVLDYYSETLRNHSKALAFLQRRGIYRLDLLAHFRLGFADRSLGHHLRKMSRLQEEMIRGALQRVGLLRTSGHELFRGAVLFPMLDQQGQILGGYGRRITPKLTAHSAYHVHWHLEHRGFFNQAALFEFPELILCKSPIEALTWWYHGHRNVAAIQGFAGFDDEHLHLLQNSLIKLIYIAFGTSRPELDEARRIAHLLAENSIEVRVVLFPLGLDGNGFASSVDDPAAELSRLLKDALALPESKGGGHEH